MLPTSTPASLVPDAPAADAAPGSQKYIRIPSPVPVLSPSPGAPLMGSVRMAPLCHAPSPRAARLDCSMMVPAAKRNAASWHTWCNPERPCAPPSTRSGGAGGGGDIPAMRAVARSPSTRSSSFVRVKARATSTPSAPRTRSPARISMRSTSHPPWGGGGGGGGGAGGSSPSFGRGGGGGRGEDRRGRASRDIRRGRRRWRRRRGCSRRASPREGCPWRLPRGCGPGSPARSAAGASVARRSRRDPRVRPPHEEV